MDWRFPWTGIPWQGVAASQRLARTIEPSQSFVRTTQKRTPNGCACVWKGYEKDTKLKADELTQKRMTFCPSGFNFNDRMIL